MKWGGITVAGTHPLQMHVDVFELGNVRQDSQLQGLGAVVGANRLLSQHGEKRMAPGDTDVHRDPEYNSCRSKKMEKQEEPQLQGPR